MFFKSAGLHGYSNLIVSVLIEKYSNYKVEFLLLIGFYHCFIYYMKHLDANVVVVWRYIK